MSDARTMALLAENQQRFQRRLAAELAAEPQPRFERDGDYVTCVFTVGEVRGILDHLERTRFANSKNGWRMVQHPQLLYIAAELERALEV